MKFGIYFIDNFTQMIFIIREIVMISLNNQKFAKIVSLDPCLISFIKSFKVIYPDRALIFTASVLDLADQCGNGCPEIQEKVRRLDQ